MVVLGVSALPVSELRGGIPLAIVHYGFSPMAAFWLGVVGNLLAAALLLLLLDRVVKLLSRVGTFKGLLERLFARTRRRFRPAVARLGALALIAVVAVPLPVTGAWTGSLIAFLFGVPFRRALPLIGAGVLIAGVVVTLATVGVLEFVFL